MATLNMSMSDPATGVASVAPDDDNDLPKGPARGFHANTDGNVSIVAYDGSEAVIAVKGGASYAISVRRIKALGTDATVIALY